MISLLTFLALPLLGSFSVASTKSLLKLKGDLPSLGSNKGFASTRNPTLGHGEARKYTSKTPQLSLSFFADSTSLCWRGETRNW